MLFQGISAKGYGMDQTDCSAVQPAKYTKGSGTTGKGYFTSTLLPSYFV